MREDEEKMRTIAKRRAGCLPSRLKDRLCRDAGALFTMLLLVSPPLAAQSTGAAPGPQPFRIEKADPAFDTLIAPGATLETVASGFGFSDGPVWVRKNGAVPGYLLISSIIGNALYKVTPQGKVTLFMDKAGYSSDDFLHDGKLAYIGRIHMILIGPNCTGIDPQGRLVWCAGQDRAVKRMEKDGRVTVLADRGDGKRFNGPNDVAIARNGAIYLTDSDVGLRGGIDGGLAEQPDSVWLIKDGKVTRVVSRDELGSEPNGIALSPDDKYLYLSAGTMTGHSRMMRYPVLANGTVGKGEVFTEGSGIGDGMKADPEGNIWSTGPMPGIIRITTPGGKLLGLLHMPMNGDREPQRAICASALAFGGDDARTLYITACDDIYAIKLKKPGALEGPVN
jgi:gluconolactonase